MPVEIQIYLNKGGLSWKAWLLGSHCHDSEGSSEAQRAESLVIAEIHFLFSLKMSLYFIFFSVQMTRSPAQQEKVCRKTQAWGCTVSPCGDTRIFQMYPRSWGEMGEGAHEFYGRMVSCDNGWQTSTGSNFQCFMIASTNWETKD